MKLNLGCGTQHISGYVNVDMFPPCDLKLDLLKFPWPWESSSCDEILMLDFLEHIEYAYTDELLQESWRVLKLGGSIVIQVPDFEHCAMAALDMHVYLCNVCGNSGKDVYNINDMQCCAQCKTPTYRISEAAIKRLFGGQDRAGNYHHNAFTKELLELKLKKMGFDGFEYLEKHHQWKNWNFKIKALKTEDIW